MCNLYSITRNQAAIRDLFKVARDTTGNLPPLPAIFPDQVAPVVRVNEGERELTMMRWGMPNPPQHPGITTNIRNTGSPHWRRWLAPESRCLVPMSSFCEYADTKPKKTPEVVCNRREPTAGRVRRDMDRMDRRSRHESKSGRGQASALRLPDDRAERHCCASASQGHAGDFDEAG
jgi:SOS response associated peptidase (SRAP)